MTSVKVSKGILLVTLTGEVLYVKIAQFYDYLRWLSIVII